MVVIFFLFFFLIPTLFDSMATKKNDSRQQCTKRKNYKTKEDITVNWNILFDIQNEEIAAGILTLNQNPLQAYVRVT